MTPKTESAALSRPPKQERKRYALTDVGNAERLVDVHGRDLRWVQRWKTWLVWDGRRWRRDETLELERRAKGVVREMFTEAAKLPSDERKPYVQHAVQSEGMSRLDAMTRLARSVTGVPILHDALDQTPMLLTVRNGTVDLRTGDLRPHDRGHLGTKLADIAYDPAAQCPTWLATLNVIFSGDAALLGYFQRAVGYSLTGDTREQVLHLCYGSGANGKSTVLDVMADLAGEYGCAADFSTFLEQGNSSGPRNDVARLAGARLVRSSEVGEGKKLNEGLIKSLTGGDVVSARFLYSEDFEFKPQFKLWLAANHKPVIRGNDHAIWRRVRLIPFEVTIPPEQRDGQLPDKLRAELPGILAWAVAGCLEWLAEGLRPPDRVMAATEEYRTESDSLGAFLAEECEAGQYHEVRAGDLYAAYKRWAKENGEWEMSNQAFGRRITERGFGIRKDMNGKLRTGLRLQRAGSQTSGHYDDEEKMFGDRDL